MSIAKFCQRRRLPQRRTLRLVKKQVEKRIGENEAKGSWRVNLSEQIGVRAHRKAESARIAYEVTNSDLLFTFVTRSIGAALLTEEELGRIISAARAYYRLAMDEHEEFVITSRDTGGRFYPNEEGYFEPLDKALRRMGA